MDDRFKLELHLRQARTQITEAKHEALGPINLLGGKRYPEIDVESFEELVAIEKSLNTLLSRMKINDRSHKDNELQSQCA